MADLVLTRRPPVEAPLLHVPPALVSARAVPPIGRFSFRGDAVAAKACGDAFGAVLPRDANRASVGGERAALWLGPDEWLLLVSEAESASLFEELSAALNGVSHSLVDISHRQMAIELHGPRAAALLNASVLLDLDEAAFPVNAATRTIFAKAEIVLWRKAADCFHIEVWRSFAPYLVGLLTEASRGIPG